MITYSGGGGGGGKKEGGMSPPEGTDWEYHPYTNPQYTTHSTLPLVTKHTATPPPTLPKPENHIKQADHYAIGPASHYCQAPQHWVNHPGSYPYTVGTYPPRGPGVMGDGMHPGPYPTHPLPHRWWTGEGTHWVRVSDHPRGVYSHRSYPRVLNRVEGYDRPYVIKDTYPRHGYDNVFGNEGVTNINVSTGVEAASVGMQNVSIVSVK